MQGDSGVFRIFIFLIICWLLIPGVLSEALPNNTGSGSVPVITNPSGTMQASADLIAAPLNPEFIAYQARTERATLDQAGKDQQSAGNDVIMMNDGTTRPFVSGLIPSPLDLSYSKGLSPAVPPSLAIAGGTMDGLPPAKYDLRDYNRVSPVKDQGGAGICWGFATMASLESSLLPGESWDFSENNLKDVMADTQAYGWDRMCADPAGLADGGNALISSAYLTRWAGPVTEASDPYSDTTCILPATVHPVRHVQDILFIPQRTSSTDNAWIKTVLMNQGAVMASIYYSGSNYNPTMKAFYNPSGSASTNHAITIVGWDDTYSRYNFSTTAPVDGAFIVKNSWGTGWGDHGYFYISYADSTIGNNCVAFTGGPASIYDHEYSYDPLGWVTNVGTGSSSTIQFANVFTAGSDETLNAIGVYDTAPGTFTTRVYLDPSTGPINASGYVSQTSWTDYTFGYRIIRIPDVTLRSGQKFSIVVLASTPGNNWPMPAEYAIAGRTSKATALPGQSYYSLSGASWTDLTSWQSTANTNIKAFTRDNGKVGVFRPSTHTFYLSTPGAPTSSINWGVSTDIPVTGNWNGDGVTDVGVFRPSTHTFYLKTAGSPTTTVNWGVETDTPVTGDWNGDDMTEVGVFRPSTHMFYLNIPGSPTSTVNWGVGTDIPVTGDWNGDGKTEVGVFRPSTHSFYLNIPGSATTTINWGVSTDTPVTGDMNGDGITEVGVFRPSTHMFYFKIPGSPTQSINWGVGSDMPVTGKWWLAF